MTNKTRELAEDAMLLFSSKSFTAACRKLDDALVEDWRRAITPEAREEAYRDQKALRDIQCTLLAFIDDAARELSRRGEKENVFTAFLKLFSFTKKIAD